MIFVAGHFSTTDPLTKQAFFDDFGLLERRARGLLELKLGLGATSRVQVWGSVFQLHPTQAAFLVFLVVYMPQAKFYYYYWECGEGRPKRRETRASTRCKKSVIDFFTWPYCPSTGESFYVR